MFSKQPYPKSFAPGFVSQKEQERQRRLAAMEKDPDEAEQEALEAVEAEARGSRFEE
jgi:hypothetical protein